LRTDNEKYESIENEILNKLISSEIEYGFRDIGGLIEEISLRKNIVREMDELVLSPIECSSKWQPVLSEKGESKYWERREVFGIKGVWVLRKGVEDAYEAMLAWRKKGAKLDCLGAVYTAIYSGYIKTKLQGRERLNPEEYGLRLPMHQRIAPLGLMGNKERYYIPGDHWMFWNFRDYYRYHPRGAWGSEHTIYMGNGFFIGFGVDRIREDALLELLLKKFNEDLPPEIKRRELFDLDPQRTRFPDKMWKRSNPHLEASIHFPLR